MEVPRLQLFVVALFFIVYLSVLSECSSVKASRGFSFNKQPKRFLVVAFSSNLQIDCSTNALSAYVSLYFRQMASRPWKKLFPKVKKIIKTGDKFTILDFDISDSGQYQCRARNKKGRSIKWKKGYGNVIPNPNLIPDVKIFPKHAVDLTTGQSYNISCSSVEHTTLQWFKKLSNGSETVVPSEKTYLERDLAKNKLKLILMIKNAQKSDSGIYRCVMTYNRRKNSKYTSLRIYDLFKFTSQPKRYLVVSFNTNLRINCSTNEPNAHVTLYFRKMMLQPWKKLMPKKKRIVKNEQIFTILNFGISNAGQYQCRAVNGRGDTIKWKQGYGNVIPNPKLTPPVHIKPNHPIVLTVGQSYNITCSSVAYTTLQWFKEFDNGTTTTVPRNQIIRKSDRKKNILILMMKDSREKDSGTYKCVMTYNRRKRYKYASLKILAKDAIPYLKGRDKNISVNKTLRVTLSCAATGNPLPKITWKKDSNLIGCSSNGKSCGPNLQYALKNKVKSKNKTKFIRSQLKIHRVSQMRDQGDYTCVATNKHGVARRKFNLTVK